MHASKDRVILGTDPTTAAASIARTQIRLVFFTRGPKMSTSQMLRRARLGALTAVTRAEAVARLFGMIVLITSSPGVNDVLSTAFCAHFLHDFFLRQVRLAHLAAAHLAFGFLSRGRHDRITVPRIRNSSPSLGSSCYIGYRARVCVCIYIYWQYARVLYFAPTRTSAS